MQSLSPSAANGKTVERELQFRRVFNAPAGVVFDAWTNPIHVPHWLVGDGCTTTIQEMDVRPGGVWRFTMRLPDGRDYRHKAVFLEVERPRRLVYRHLPEPGFEPVDADVTVLFEDDGDKTRLTLRMLFPTAAECARARATGDGPKQLLERLAVHLERTAEANKHLFLERILDAPRDLVYKVWTDPRHLAQWWGPGGFTNPVCEADPRPGGKINIHMQAPNGVVYPMHGHFVELVEPERIVFMSGVNEADGSSRFEIRNTVTLANHGDGKTRLTLDISVVSATDAARANLTGAEMGWTQSLDRLGRYLTTADREIVLRRVFNAPAGLVFEVWTNPAHQPYWLGGDGFTTTVHEIDRRPGGVWRFTMHGPDGRDYPNDAVFIEVDKPRRLAYRHLTEPVGAAVTVTFEDQGDKTRVTLRILFATATERELMIQTRGADTATRQSLDRVAARLDLIAAPIKRVVLERVLDAPRELVFKAFTDPAQLAEWWRPNGYTNSACEVDARPGGRIRVDMRDPAGGLFPVRGHFVEIVEPERIIFISAINDDAAPLKSELRNTVTFVALGPAKTALALECLVISSTGSAAGLEIGWNECLDRLAAQVVKS